MRARAIAILWSETDCIIADTNGTFREIEAFSPFMYFTSGVFNEILPGLQSLVVNPGINKYSLKVLEMSFNICAMGGLNKSCAKIAKIHLPFKF